MDVDDTDCTNVYVTDAIVLNLNANFPCTKLVFAMATASICNLNDTFTSRQKEKNTSNPQSIFHSLIIFSISEFFLFCCNKIKVPIVLYRTKIKVKAFKA